ncbi:LegC family aminotransferase [Chitinophaga sp. LS1]|uniref:LegC family aminotransferase n=1 Tax=Chitinophaga sp. LS1 TaxID=3051176 RepID=UPI002AAB44FC|nr:LegC family aminotransferase [Chitinophaga sp. LS1]WPV64446.1 LegC family aminotransferase [Chitinophaga sp. LS1]
MIPLSVPNLAGNEWKYVKDCLDTNWVSSVGSYVNQFEEMSAAFTHTKKAIATSNGTAALHISLLLADVKQGDLVVCPNITFVAPVNVIKYLGADPVLIDVDAYTWQLDVNLLESFLSNNCDLEDDGVYHKDSGKRVSAIVPVHVLGNMVDMEQLMVLSKKFNIPVVEDATEALGSTYHGQPAGSMGLFGCLSYNGNKIITTGGGGMILTNDEELGKKAKHLTTQAKSDPMEYFHDEVGYNYRLVNILAAMGVAQMEQLPDFIERKRVIAALYNEGLKDVPGFMSQVLTMGVVANCWLYTAAFPNSRELLQFLNQKGVQTRPFWVPMNRLPAFANDIYYSEADISNMVYEQCLSLPCSTNITDDEVKTVIAKIKEFYA